MGRVLSALGVGYGLDGPVIGVALEASYAVLVHVGGVDNRLEAEQVDRLYQLALVLRTLKAARAQALVEVRVQALEDLGLAGELLIAALRGLLRFVYAALDQLHVGHDEFEVDDVDVARGVGAAVHVDDVLVVEAAHDVDDGVRAADILEELVAQALALLAP